MFCLAATHDCHLLFTALRYEGNPCNSHLLGLGQRVKASLHNAGLTGYQFGAVGVSDGISMGTDGMHYSLPSRDLIADSVESAAGGHWLDGCVVVPGCDKVGRRLSFLRFSGHHLTEDHCFITILEHARSVDCSRTSQ